MRRYSCLLWICLIALHLSSVTEAMHRDTEDTQQEPTNSTTTTTTEPTTSSTTQPTTSSTTQPTTSSTTQPTTRSTTQPTTSSTTQPTTSSTTQPTTSSTTQPTTPVPFKDYDFVVKDKDGKACIASTMTINLNVQYKTNQNAILTKSLTVPKNALVSGGCDAERAIMILTWRAGVTLIEADEDNNVAVTFLTKDSRVAIDRIIAKIYLDENNFPDAAETTVQLATAPGLGLFSTSTVNSVYKCAIETAVGSENGGFAISNVSLLPVKGDTDVSDLTEENCVAEAGVNTGAIIGGVVGGLVVSSIIGYVIWRRRKQSREQRSNLAKTDKYL